MSASSKPWQALFGTPSSETQAVVLGFTMLRRHGHPLLALPRRRACAVAGLELYPAQSFKARFARGLLRVALQSGLPVLPLGLELRLSPENDFVRFLAATAGAPPDTIPEFAILAGNPMSPAQRHLLLAFDSCQRPVAVVKAGTTEAARALLAHEAGVLERLPDGLVGVPSVCRRFESASVAAFATDFVRGNTPQSDDLPSLATLLTAWLHAERRERVAGLPPWPDLLTTLQTDSLLPALTSFGEAKVAPALFHGDLAPWNIKATGTRWMVLDWERGQPNGLPAWDWFHFVLQPALLVRRLPISKLIHLVEDLLASSSFQEYARLSGLRGYERACLLGYVAWCHRVIRQSEGAETMEGLERALCQRWFSGDSASYG